MRPFTLELIFPVSKLGGIDTIQPLLIEINFKTHLVDDFDFINHLILVVLSEIVGIEWNILRRLLLIEHEGGQQEEGQDHKVDPVNIVIWLGATVSILNWILISHRGKTKLSVYLSDRITVCGQIGFGM